jgi:hypothetical protein
MSTLKNIKLAHTEYNDIVPSTKAAIKFRPFRVSEEKMLLIASESKDTQQMSNAMKSIINNCAGVECDTLPFYDVEYLFTKIRSKSVGENVNITYPCEKCDEENELAIELDKVYVSENTNESNEVKIDDNLVFVLVEPTIGMMALHNPDEVEIENIINMLANGISQVQNGEEVIDVTPKDVPDIKALIEQLTSEQFKKLSDYYENIPKTSLDYEFKCSKCSTINKSTLTGMQNFF